MSDCIVRMEFRKNCLDCDLHQIVYGDSYADTDVYCFREKRLVGKRFGPTKDLARPDWCPIICSLPEGHGRLGDLDAFEKDVSNALIYGLKEIPTEEGKQIFHVLMQEVLDNVKKRKTIVPAERREV